jgi:hypothetical protein
VPNTVLAFEIFLFFIPGFLSLKVLDILTVRMKTTQMMELATAFLFTLINYAIYLLLARWLSFIEPLTVTVTEDLQTINLYGLNAVSVVFIVLISFFTGGLFGFLLNKGWGYWLLRKIKLTIKTGRPSVWWDIFNEVKKKWIVVHLNDDNDTRIYGYAGYVPENPEEKDLFIAEASFLDDENKEHPIPGPGILLSAAKDVKFIEFVDPVNDKEGKT